MYASWTAVVSRVGVVMLKADDRGRMSGVGTNLTLCLVVLVWGPLLSSTDFNNSIFLSSFLPFFLSSFLPFFLSSFLPFFLSSFLPFFLSSFLPFFLSSFLPFFLSS